MEKDNEIENLQVKRKLASVQIVASVTAHPNDNTFDLVKILEWQVITPKGDFKKDDVVAFFEIDSLLPDERFCSSLEFHDFKVSTVKIAGELSQGFIAHINEVFKDNKFKVGDDITEELNIVKYDDEERASSNIDEGKFPVHLVPFTDEPRAQSEPKYINAFLGKPYVATIKYDGTSATYLLNPQDSNELWICSRNKIIDQKKKDDYWKISEKYKIKEKLQAYKNFCIQGEVYGPGIQKNLLGVKDKMLAVFNVFDISEKRCLDYDEMKEFCEKIDIPVVALYERGDSFNFTIDELFEKVKGNYEGTNNQREGLVFRLAKNWYTPCLRYSFKIISNDFLLKK